MIMPAPGVPMIIENRPYDQLEIGDQAELRRFCSEQNLLVFAVATGNHNPMHLPDADFDGDGQPEAIASGIFVAALVSSLLGTVLPGPGTLYQSQSLTFHSHARAGETLCARVRVMEKFADGRVRLETEVVLDGTSTRILSGEAVVLAPRVGRSFDGADLPGLVVQQHRQFDALIQRAEALSPLVCAVVCPHSPEAMDGALVAMRRGLIRPILLGDPAKIRAVAEGLGLGLDGVQIIEAAEEEGAARAGVELVRSGQAGALMKGHLHTDALLRPVLDKAQGLMAGNRLSHVFVMDVPALPHPLLITDAAINIAPDLADKAAITQNAIDLARAIGIRRPRVAILSAVETVNPAIPSSVDGALLAKMAERGQITGGVVDGPLALDNAVDAGAARAKGIRSLVAGRAEVLVVPGLEAGNLLAKELIYLSGAEAAGVALGASVPIILTSRADSAKARLASAAIAVLWAHRAG